MIFRLRRVLAFSWLLPATIFVWTFYIFPAWALKWIRFDGSPELLVAAFVVRKHKAHPWYSKYWEDWSGWSGPCVVITKEDPDDNLRYKRTLKHELRHCQQQFLFGVFHYPLYALASIAIWVAYPDLHPYYDNPFEVDARKAAGQVVHIPKSHWGKSAKKRWNWW